MAVPVDGPDAEEDIVFGKVDGCGGDITHRDRKGPVRFGARPPDDLVAGQVRFGAPVPAQAGIVGQLGGVDDYVLRRAGRVGQRPQRGGVDLGGPSEEVEVDELDQVAELDTVDHPDVLVLVGEVLVRLGEPVGRIALLQERNVVAATQV